MDIYCNENINIINKANIKDYFSIVYTREDAKEIKPNPEIYLRIVNVFLRFPLAFSISIPFMPLEAAFVAFIIPLRSLDTVVTIPSVSSPRSSIYCF